MLVWRRNGSAKTAIGQSGRGDRREKMEPFALVGARDLDGFFLAATLNKCDTSRRELVRFRGPAGAGFHGGCATTGFVVA